MLFFEEVSGDAELFDEFSVFISQLRASGTDARMTRASIPEKVSRNVQFDVANLVSDEDVPEGGHLSIINAHKLSAQRVAGFRKLSFPSGASVSAVGRFPSLQERIGARSRLSYVMGPEPDIVDDSAWGGGLPVIGVRSDKGHRRSDRPEVLLLSPPVSTDEDVAAIRSWTSSSSFEVSVMVSGKDKEKLRASEGDSLRVYHYSELLPAQSAPMFDAVVAFCAPKSYRVRSLLANIAASRSVLSDCSPAKRISSSGRRWLSGPADVRSASFWFSTEVMPAFKHAMAETEKAPPADMDAAAALQAMGIKTDFVKGADRKKRRERRIVMMPTNGIGLGHAQRCSLIAGEMTDDAPTFAAFPSCMRMLQGYGFDVMPLVSRSTLHLQEHDNDAINRARLDALCEEGGTFVFDGGYVFDSVVRTISEKRMRGIWVRRGMWQPGQSNSIALDREKVFHKVIVPEECFPELNETYSRGGHVENVGPIVQKTSMGKTEKRRLRRSLAAKFGKFDKLVVTMLGGGVAADRSMQMSAIAASLSVRPGTLHLIVAWPTARIPASVHAWPNTRVVKTHHASALVAAADLYVSAAGYNSFHEAMYNAVPTIFVAQMNSFMDDQEKRAMAAVSRGLADMAAPEEMSALSRMISDHLDGGRGAEIASALARIDLPEPGNRAAAEIITGKAQG